MSDQLALALFLATAYLLVGLCIAQLERDFSRMRLDSVDPVTVVLWPGALVWYVVAALLAFIAWLARARL